MKNKQIYVGTSGWSYKHWKDIFYPEKMKAIDYLSHLSSQFDCTEINTSFYRLPQPDTISHWKKAVPASFKFCPKMSRYLTQMKKLHDPEEPLSRFFSIFEPMKRMMGPVLLQLPAQLGFHKERTESFFQILKNDYGIYKFALECRHASWLEREAIKLLRRYRISFVIADSGGRFPMGEFITAKDIYVRFHGPDGFYGTSYEPDVLEWYADKCNNWVAKGHRVWVFFNNDVHGYAIKNAITLKELLNLK